MNPAHPDYPFPPGQHPARQPKRRGKGSNVVALRKVETADTILEELEARTKAQNVQILHMLREATANLQQRREEDIASLARIGRALNPDGLANWIKVGRRLAGWEAGR